MFDKLSIERGFVISRFFFMFFAVTGGKENRSSYGGLRYIEVRYIEVPLYFREKYMDN